MGEWQVQNGGGGPGMQGEGEAQNGSGGRGGGQSLTREADFALVCLSFGLCLDSISDKPRVGVADRSRQPQPPSHHALFPPPPPVPRHGSTTWESRTRGDGTYMPYFFFRLDSRPFWSWSWSCLFSVARRGHGFSGLVVCCASGPPVLFTVTGQRPTSPHGTRHDLAALKLFLCCHFFIVLLDLGDLSIILAHRKFHLPYFFGFKFGQLLPPDQQSASASQFIPTLSLVRSGFSCDSTCTILDTGRHRHGGRRRKKRVRGSRQQRQRAAENSQTAAPRGKGRRVLLALCSHH